MMVANVLHLFLIRYCFNGRHSWFYFLVATSAWQTPLCNEMKLHRHLPSIARCCQQPWSLSFCWPSDTMGCSFLSLCSRAWLSYKLHSQGAVLQQPLWCCSCLKADGLHSSFPSKHLNSVCSWAPLKCATWQMIPALEAACSLPVMNFTWPRSYLKVRCIILWPYTQYSGKSILLTVLDLHPGPCRLFMQVTISVLGEKTVYGLLELTGMSIPKANWITLPVLLVLPNKAVIKLAKGMCLLPSDMSTFLDSVTCGQRGVFFIFSVPKDISGM